MLLVGKKKKKKKERRNKENESWNLLKISQQIDQTT